jgi:phage terminase large subunit
MAVLQIKTAPVFEPLLLPARYKAAYGGRGSGKSHFFAECAVERAIEIPGTRGVCIREVQKDLKTSSKLLIEDKIKTFGLTSHFDMQTAETKTPGGGIIIYKGMQEYTADSIKSLEGFDWAWVEEAHSLSQNSLDKLRPTLRKRGSELWFSWNPELRTDPVDRFFRGPEKPSKDEAIIVRANWYDNPFLRSDDVLVREKNYDLKRDPDKYRWVWLGGYRGMNEARVFKNWKAEEFETPADVRFYHGADWGYSEDPTVLVRCFLIDNTLYVDAEAYQIGCEIDRTPALFNTIPTAANWPIIADSARPETISYVKRKGNFQITPAKKGQGSVEDGIEFLKNYNIIVHPRCRHTIDELSMYSWKVDKKTNEVLPILEDKHNHVIDALRYAVEGLRRSGASMADFL